MKALYHSHIGFAANHGAENPTAKKAKTEKLTGEGSAKIKIPWADICEMRRAHEQCNVSARNIAAAFNVHVEYMRIILRYEVRLRK